MTSVFDDPIGQQSDELSFRAERALATGNAQKALELFAEAAALETQLAERAAADEPRVRSVVALSAVALWFKARRFDECERLALQLLAGERLTDQGRVEVRALLERCWREGDAERVARDESLLLIPVDMKLDGGRIRKGLAPSAIVRDRQQIFASMLVRTAEWKMSAPFRRRGEAKKDVLAKAGIYEAPALAASYGVCLYVGSSRKVTEVHPELNAESVVSAFLELAAAAQATSLESVVDADYRASFLAGFRDLAPDGGGIETVGYSTSAAHLRAPSPVFLPADRERLSGALVRDNNTETFVVRGVLKVVNLTREQIVIEGDDADTVTLSIDAGKFGDTIGPKLNRKVVVFAETRKGKQRDPKPYALDVRTTDEGDDEGATRSEPQFD